MSDATNPGLAEEEVSVDIGPYRVTVATTFGPRIIGLRRGSGLEILARLDPSISVDGPGGQIYKFRGGHRLWASPETPEISHAPDEHRCTVTTADGGVAVIGPVDHAGLVKEIKLSLTGSSLLVRHRLISSRPDPVIVGAWGITQLPLGGTALMPLRGRRSNGLQADRRLILWPYTRLDDTRLVFTGIGLKVDAVPGPRLKLGGGPSTSTLGYLKDGHLFVKRFEPAESGEYPDLGAVAQIFTNEDFCELESLGPLKLLKEGDHLTHEETWQVNECEGIEAAFEVLGS